MTKQNMKRVLRAAIIGCGDMAGGYDARSQDGGIYTHAGAYQESGIELVCCYDSSTSKCAAFAKEWDTTSCATMEELAANGPFDIVSICTPDNTHANIAEYVLQHLAPTCLWLEKPLATHPEDARRIVSLCATLGVGLRVTYQRRWETEHQRLASELAAGEYGDIKAVTGFYVKGLVHIGTTMLDTMRLLISEISTCSIMGPSSGGSFPGDASNHLALQFECGASGSVFGVDGDTYRYSVFELDIFCTQGRIRVIENGDRIEIYRSVPFGHYDKFEELKQVETRKTQMGRAVVVGLDQMVQHILETKGGSITDGENALRNLDLVWQARQEARP